MITWMQRHRKYLVVTIWISTIAFVGAGFVGWGAYSFNSNSSSVAKVGDRKINFKQFNLAYTNAYNYYNRMFSGKFTKEQAEQMNMQQGVINTLIDEALMLNFANDLGLVASDEDVKNTIANDKMFQKNGAFDIQKYRLLLDNMKMREQDYENSLRREILLKKLDAIITPTGSRTKELLGSTLFMEDKISMDVINANPNDIVVSDEVLKKYWEGKKDNFLTEKSYKIAEGFIGLDSVKDVSEDEIKELYKEKKFTFTHQDGKVKSLEEARADVIAEVKYDKAKKEALKKYLKVKKGKEKLSKELEIFESNLEYPIYKLIASKPNDVLKPIKVKNGYKVIKLIAINPPKPKDFMQAKEQVLAIYRAEKNQENLKILAKDKLKDFKGQDVGFVGADINSSLGGLTQMETRVFVSKVFEKNDKKSFVILGNKAVVYEVLEQKLLSKEKLKKYNVYLTQASQGLQNQVMRTKLLEMLRKRYGVEQFYNPQKGN